MTTRRFDARAFKAEALFFVMLEVGPPPTGLERFVRDLALPLIATIPMQWHAEGANVYTKPMHFKLDRDATYGSFAIASGKLDRPLHAELLVWTSVDPMFLRGWQLEKDDPALQEVLHIPAEMKADYLATMGKRVPADVYVDFQDRPVWSRW